MVDRANATKGIMYQRLVDVLVKTSVRLENQPALDSNSVQRKNCIES